MPHAKVAAAAGEGAPAREDATTGEDATTREDAYKQSSTLDWSRIQEEVADARERRDLVHEYLQGHFRKEAEAADEKLPDEARGRLARASSRAARVAMRLLP